MSTRKLTLKSETSTRASDEIMVLSAKQINDYIYPDRIILANSKYIIFKDTDGQSSAFLIRDANNHMIFANVRNSGWLTFTTTMASGNQRTFLLREYGVTDTVELFHDYEFTIRTANDDINLLPTANLVVAPGGFTKFLTGQVGIGIDPTAALTIEAGTAAAGTSPLKFTAGPLLTTVEEGAMEYKGHTLYFTTYLVRRSVVLAQEVPIADVTVANTTTETTIYSIPMAANYLTAGKHIETSLQGIFSSIAGPSGVCTIRLKYAGATVATFTTLAALNTNSPFEAEFNTTCRAIGSGTTGKLKSFCKFSEGATAVTETKVSGALTNIDTTASNTITITVQWASANAGNSITVEQGHTLCIDANT